MLGEASGYEIRKAIEEGPFSHFAEGGFGSIYPALTKLTDAGLITCKASSKNKLTAKKLYRLAEAGWRHLEATMQAKMPGDDKYKSDLLFILFFADWQDPAWIARVIDARIDFYRKKLAHMEETICDTPDMKGRALVHGYGHAVYRTALDYLVAHRADFIAAATRHETRPTAAAE